MHQIRFRLGLRCLRPRWGAHSAPPDLLAGFKGTSNLEVPLSSKGEVRGGLKRSRGSGYEGGGKERKGENRIREREGLPPFEWRSGYAPGLGVRGFKKLRFFCPKRHVLA